MSSSGAVQEGRLRRPSWRDPRLLVGLVLMAVAVAGVVAIVQRADTTAPYYAAAAPLTPGHVIERGDVVVAHVRVSEGTYMPADAGAPWGLVVTRGIGAGELLPAAALSDADDVGVRSIAIETTRPLAAGIGVGSSVDLWVTVDGDDGPHSTLVQTALVVIEVADGDRSIAGTRGPTVYVAVPEGQVGAVLDSVASGGEIALVGTTA